MRNKKASVHRNLFVFWCGDIERLIFWSIYENIEDNFRIFHCSHLKSNNVERKGYALIVYFSPSIGLCLSSCLCVCVYIYVLSGINVDENGKLLKFSVFKQIFTKMPVNNLYLVCNLKLTLSFIRLCRLRFIGSHQIVITAEGKHIHSIHIESDIFPLVFTVKARLKKHDRLSSSSSSSFVSLFILFTLI